MAVSVPDTNTFSLQDVWNAVADHNSPDQGTTLYDCLLFSNSAYFDTLYDNSGYAPALSLKRFRNYGPGQPAHTIFVPEGFSPNGDEVNDYHQIQNIEYYPVHEMKYYDSPGGSLIVSITDCVNSPWDGTDDNDDGDPMPDGTYTWVLTIDGQAHSDGTVYISR